MIRFKTQVLGKTIEDISFLSSTFFFIFVNVFYSVFNKGLKKIYVSYELNIAVL